MKKLFFTSTIKHYHKINDKKFALSETEKLYNETREWILEKDKNKII